VGVKEVFKIQVVEWAGRISKERVIQQVVTCYSLGRL
jgi:hypothetical protein